MTVIGKPKTLYNARGFPMTGRDLLRAAGMRENAYKLHVYPDLIELENLEANLSAAVFVDEDCPDIDGAPALRSFLRTKFASMLRAVLEGEDGYERCCEAWNLDSNDPESKFVWEDELEAGLQMSGVMGSDWKVLRGIVEGTFLIKDERVPVVLPQDGPDDVLSVLYEMLDGISFFEGPALPVKRDSEFDSWLNAVYDPQNTIPIRAESFKPDSAPNRAKNTFPEVHFSL